MFGIKSKNGYHEVIDGIKIKTISYGENTLMAEFILNKGAILPEHSHINEQTGYLISGKIRLYINGISQIINPGDSWNIKSNVMHKAKILENSIAIEIFSPCREDYLKYINIEDVLD